MRVARNTINAVFVVATAGLCAGCVDNTLSFAITKFAVLEAANGCAASISSTTTLNNGILDVGIAAEGYDGYRAAPVIENRLLPGTAMIETNSIQVTGVEVELQPSPGLAASIPSSQRKFFVPAAGGILAPAGGTGGIVVEVIPRQLAVSLANVLPQDGIPERVVVRLRPVGKRAGLDIDGGPTDLPVDICKYCLSPPPDPCPQEGIASSDILLGSCFPAQDTHVTCCRTDTTLCGADVPVAE